MIELSKLTNRLFQIVVFFSLLLDIMARNYSYLFSEHFYYKAEAIMIFSICSYAWYIKDSWITFLIFMLSLNNICDECFFNPTELGINEKIFGGITIIILLIRYILNIRTNEKYN